MSAAVQWKSPGSASASDPKVSGTVVLNQLRAARSMVGDTKVDQAIATLTPEHQLQLRALLPVSWCSLATVRALHEAVAAQIGEPVNAWHLRVVERSMQQTFSTVWRFFLKLANPDSLVKRAAAIYAKTYDTGSMDVVIIAPGHSRSTLTGWPDVPDYQLNAIATGITTMLKVAGRTGVHVRWTRTPQGARFETHTSPVS